MSLNLLNRCMSRKMLVLLMLAVAAAQAWAAVPIGRVLAVTGQLQAQREGKAVELLPGAEVFVGDALTTASNSQAQVRFDDQSIVALRPDTQFRVDAYSFKDPRQNEAGFFSLLKGGFRTITGLIGKTNRDAYKVATPTSTIGIRGTHYLVRLCDKDCKQDDGTAAAAGLYGGVVEGRIAVGNEAGTHELGGGEYFYVADLKSLPLPLAAPPAFLREKPASIGKAQGAAGGAEASARVAPAPQTDAATGAPVSAVASSLLPALRVADLSTASSSLAHVAPVTIDNGGGSTGGGGFVNVGGSGTLRGQVIWMTTADLDLHLKTPGGAEVYFANSQVTLHGGAIAKLDHDNTGGVIDVAPDQRVENIVVNGTAIQVGTYTYFVYNFSGNNGGAPTTALVKVSGADGTTTQYSTTLADHATSPDYVVSYSGSAGSTAGASAYSAAWAHAATSPSTYTNSNASGNFSGTGLTATSLQALGGGTTAIGGVSRNGSALVDAGSSLEAGNVTWGRWSSGLANYPSSNTPAGGIHLAIGDATPASAIPVTGTVPYSRVGGTLPTDSGGNVGTWNGGSLVLNFSDRSVTTGTPLSWSVANHNYSATFSAVAIGSGNTVLTSAGTCTGGGCGTGSPINYLNLNGTLAGSSAQGAILSITSQTSAATFPTTSSVQVFKR